MKILFAVQRYGPEIIGGSEYATRQFAERLVARGHEVTVVTSCAVSYADWSNVFPPGVTTEGGVTIVRLPVVASRDNDVFGELHAKVLRRDPMFHFEQKIWAMRIGPELMGYTEWLTRKITEFDCVVFKSYLYFPATQGLPLVAGKVPTVFHAEAHPEEMLDLPLYDGLFRLPDAFQFGTPEERELIQQRFGFEPDGSTVGVGIDLPADLDDAVLDDRLREICRGPFALVLGRLGEGKGTKQLLDYFEKYVDDTQTDLTLVFAGEKPESSTAFKNVAFAGFLSEEEKQLMLERAVCLVQPSLLESFSIVLIEAWNVGTPVLADGRGAVVAGQLARSGGGLTYHSYGDFKVGLDAMQRSDTRDQTGASGRQFVDAHYRWDKVLDRFEGVIATARRRFDLRAVKN